MSDVVIISDKEIKSKSKKSKDVEALPADADELPFTVSLIGSYQNLVLLLSDIDNALRPAKIDSLAINSSKTDEGKTLVLMISGRLPFVKN